MNIGRTEAKKQGLSRYFTGKSCVRGHVSERSVATGHCSECERERSRKRFADAPEMVRAKVRMSYARHAERTREKRSADNKLWRQEDPERYAAYARSHYEKNRDAILVRSVEARLKNVDQMRARANAQREKNKDAINESQRIFRLKNPGYVKSANLSWREKHGRAYNKKLKLRAATDPVYAFNRRARCLIGGAIRRAGFSKAQKTENLLGCSIAEFRAQIERQFLPKMGWDNMELWEIDHIVPISLARTQAEAEALNLAGNLRPLWRVDNRIKQAKQTHLI